MTVPWPVPVPWLSLLYLVHVLLSIAAALLLSLVIILLRRFDVFHVNLRTLLTHALLCLLLNLCLQMIRPTIPMLQNMFFLSSADDTSFNHKQLASCPQFNALPAPFCAFICTTGILICMERLYATFNFAKYENENFDWLLARIFKIKWALFVLYVLSQLYSDLVPGLLSSSYWHCLLHQVRVDPLKTHWHFLFAILFHCVFCIVLYVVLIVNREKQEVYVKFHYSSLSHRFQIAENVRSVQLLLRVVPQMCVAISFLLLHAVWLFFSQRDYQHEKTDTDANLLLWVEGALLAVPLSALAISATIVRSSNVFISKSRLIAQEFFSQLWRPTGQPIAGAKQRAEEIRLL